MSPKRPFEADPAGTIWQVPMVVSRRLRLPVIGTTIPMYGMSAPDRAHADIYNLEFHAIDLVDDSDGLPRALANRQHDVRTAVAAKRHSFRAAFRTLRQTHRFRPLREACGQRSPDSIR